VTVRRSAVREVGGFEDGFLTLCEDWLFWQKIYLYKNVYVTSDVVARYRKHAGSVLYRAALDRSSLLGQRYQLHLAYLRWLHNYLEQHGAEESVMRLIRSKLWPEGSSLLRNKLGLPPALGLTVKTATRRAHERLRHAVRETIDEIKGKPTAKA
jgi:hypothetical protein